MEFSNIVKEAYRYKHETLAQRLATIGFLRIIIFGFTKISSTRNDQILKAGTSLSWNSNYNSLHMGNELLSLNTTLGSCGLFIHFLVIQYVVDVKKLQAIISFACSEEYEPTHLEMFTQTFLSPSQNYSSAKSTRQSLWICLHIWQFRDM